MTSGESVRAGCARRSRRHVGLELLSCGFCRDRRELRLRTLQTDSLDAEQKAMQDKTDSEIALLRYIACLFVVVAWPF